MWEQVCPYISERGELGRYVSYWIYANKDGPSEPKNVECPAWNSSGTDTYQYFMEATQVMRYITK